MKNNIHAVVEEPQADQESKMNGSPLTSPDWKEEFMACLAVPVFADMRQQDAIALREANKPDTLYRYRSLNKEVLERELQNIEQQQVWMTQPCYANDPFDSSFSLAYEAYVLPKEAKEQAVSRFEPSLGGKLDQAEIAELANMFQISKERFRYLFSKAFPDEPIEAADAILEAFRTTTRNVNRGHVRELNEFTKQNLSVCCFCERNDEILMWTHYADEHR
jgi:hypothetical protein